ncbi:hypothetical protein BaRGS_00004104 [Batillaria attramentaria]|uniref:C2H2-type domain-containing protein n=1 Tax=Batillaria attramentaria TaxID=370345 RepID=A0ABD0M001_9CAEN
MKSGDACCVCSKSNTLAFSKSLDVVGTHFKQVLLCSKVCEQVLVQALTFVQGFLLGKVVSCVQKDRFQDVRIPGHYNSSAAVKEEPSPPSPGSDIFSGDEPAVFFDDLELKESRPSPAPDSTHSLSVASVALKRLPPGKYRSAASEKATKRKLSHSKLHEKTKHAKQRKKQRTAAQSTRSKLRKVKELEPAKEKREKKPVFDEGCEDPDSAAAAFSAESSDDTQESAEKQWTVSCPDCGKGFNNTKTMKAHVRVKHQNNIKVCRVCGQKCYGQIGLSLHMKSKHAGEKANECEICNERFPYSTDLERHVTLVHGKDRFICHICGKHFRYWHTLQSHVKAHSGVRAYVCEHCGKGFLRGNTLIDHKKSHFCRVCKKKLISGQCPDHPKPRYTYNYQSGLSLLQCKECSATFESIEALETHVKTHELQRPYHCQVCGKGFHTSQHLYKHSKQHEEKQFQCGICAKKFTYKCNMQKHQETHAEDRPFSCEFCSRTFKNKRALDTHLPRHIEEKQFKCHICGKGLTRRAKLKEHLLKMHPVA